MKETREKKLKKKSMHFFAAAALSAALISGQMPMSIAADSGAKIEMSELIPDNITVDAACMLADVKLPEMKYGKLKWVDDSIWLTERVQSCEVLFIPEDGFDLSRLEDWDEEDWDEEAGGLLTHMKVVVSSIEEKSYDEEEVEEVTELPNDTEVSGEPETTVMPDSEETKENTGKTDETDKKTGSTEGEAQDSDKKTEENAETGADAEKESGEGNTENKDSVKPSEESKDSEQTPEKENVQGDNTDKEADFSEDTSSEDTESTDSKEENTDTEDADSTENSDSGAENTDNNNDGNKPDNIFDTPQDFETADERPMDVPENLTEEEQLLRGQINHCSEGISVSGINLPWYVQFRVTNGESYDFTNESDAMIFRSYEFELWDLQNNTEYEIPDGEYISVTVPVKEGYDYTIEHLLDNGAYETIIPSVDGTRLVFSTHSFSPFGIAGSKQLVGPDFPIEEVKPSVTPTPSVTGKPGDTNGTNGSNNGNGTGSGNSTNGTNGGTGTNGSADSNGSAGINGGTGSNGSGTGTNGAGSNGSGISDGNGGSNGSGASAGTNSGADRSSQSANEEQARNNSHAVQTGDTTPILPFVILILAAAILIGAVIFIRKKK